MLKILPNTYLPVTIKNQWELEKENYKKLNGVILTDFKDNLLGTLCQALFFSTSSFTSPEFKESKIGRERIFKTPNWLQCIRFYCLLYLLY